MEAAARERRRRAGAGLHRLGRGARLRPGRGRRDPDRTSRGGASPAAGRLVGAERYALRPAVPRGVLRPRTAARCAALGPHGGAVRSSPRSWSTSIPWDADSDTEVLVALHLPVALWFAVAYPYMGGTLRSHERRMDFVRFTGEWFIYYVLIALGGGVLMALIAGIFQPAGVDGDRIAQWVVPSGAAGAVVVAAWLVESKQRVVENMAPVLSMIFTPLFAVMLTIRRPRLCGDRSGRCVRPRASQRPRRPAAGRPRARPVRDVRAGPVDVAELDGSGPARRRRQRPCARPDGARRDDRPDRRPRVHPEPNGSSRAQPRPAREPSRRRLARRAIRQAAQRRSTGSSDGRRPTCPSSRCGRRRSWSSSRRCSASPDRRNQSLRRIASAATTTSPSHPTGRVTENAPRTAPCPPRP